MQNHWQVINNRQNNNTPSSRSISDSPKDLWDAACEYFKWCDDNPVISKFTVRTGKEAGKKFEEEQQRPYSINGLCLHLGILKEYLNDVRASKDTGSEYYHVVTTIMYIIYVQNYEYAVLGIFNPVFTSKVLSLDNDTTPRKAATINIIQGLPRLASSESEVLEKLEQEKRDSGNSSGENL